MFLLLVSLQHKPFVHRFFSALKLVEANYKELREAILFLKSLCDD